VRSVSVACARIDETRYRLRRLDTTVCEGLYADALHLPDAEDTAALVRERIGVTVP
jgi:phosphoenolpyruvate-protein kinase (PTS system EI component)